MPLRGREVVEKLENYTDTDGTDIFSADDDEESFTSETPAKAKEINYDAGDATTLKIHFELKGGLTGIIMYARVYKNGVAHGTERSQTPYAYASFDENLAFTAGDTIELWVWSSSSPNIGKVKNFRVLGTKNVVVQVGGVYYIEPVVAEVFSVS